jgi:hypothetical protein
MITSVADVGRLEQLEELPARESLVLGVDYLVVVGVARRQCLLKDCRIRRHASERIVANATVQLTIVQHSAIDAVEPDGLAGIVNLL